MRRVTGPTRGVGRHDRHLPRELLRFPYIVGIKESGSDIGQIAEYVARTPSNFTVLAGSATTLVHALCAGCDGAILALASLAPAECVSMAALVREKRLDEATTLQRRLMPLARSVGSTYGVPGLKAALELTGYAGGAPRPPLRPVSSEVVDIIRRQLDALHLTEAAKTSAVR